MAVESPILSLNAWHLPDTEEYRVMFQPKANEARREEKPALSEDAQRNVERFIQWLRSKRYSRNTIKVYTEAIGVFCGSFPTKGAYISPIWAYIRSFMADIYELYAMRPKIGLKIYNKIVDKIIRIKYKELWI